MKNLYKKLKLVNYKIMKLKIGYIFAILGIFLYDRLWKP